MRSTFRSPSVQNTIFGAPLQVGSTCSKSGHNMTQLWSETNVKEHMWKPPQHRITFGSWDVRREAPFKVNMVKAPRLTDVSKTLGFPSKPQSDGCHELFFSKRIWTTLYYTTFHGIVLCKMLRYLQLHDNCKARFYLHKTTATLSLHRTTLHPAVRHSTTRTHTFTTTNAM